MINSEIKATNEELTTKLERYKKQEKCFEIDNKKCHNLKFDREMLSIKIGIYKRNLIHFK